MGRGHCNAFKKLIASFEPNYLIMSKAKAGAGTRDRDGDRDRIRSGDDDFGFWD
jgi:hypothetical protein